MSIRRMLLVPILAVGLVGAEALTTPAGASSSVAAHPFVGTYCTTVAWTNPVTNGSFTMIVNADGTVTVPSAPDSTVTWSHRGTHITITSSGSGAAATYLGKKTKRGFNSAAHPGTMSNTEGNSGTWYAVVEAGGCASGSPRALSGR